MGRLIARIKEFLERSNVFGLILGILGASAVVKLFGAFIDDLLRPSLLFILKLGDLAQLQLVLSQNVDGNGHATTNALKLGHFVIASFDFAVTATIVLIAMFVLKRAKKGTTAKE